MKPIIQIFTAVFLLCAERVQYVVPRSTPWVKFGKTSHEYRYHISSNLMEFDEAERRCQRYRPTAHLVSIHSEEENDFVQSKPHTNC
ncbi:hypothetical protein Y032_0940g3138 [Ancylostoma ceylanicum]|uniref:Uncharacterized protein n=1 Tax=Ancylostoma ceylanicum TaxID=53326 RepID=A0A016WAP6_9BILA|nr:hypothetical protein Y032_0940g3138 [Ancylostoma ceylanicum]